ncbi:MAG: hypothetical protein E4H36_13580 [Spirochaetales bacterium]|nr:MAG: hypothetical protein E4H36_13580 [Spirochaetales bacterium]
MENIISFRCQSCGAGLSAERSAETVQCRYCGAQFMLPDPAADPGLYSKTFQSGYDVEHDQDLIDAIRWVNRKGPNWYPSLSSFGTSLDFSSFHTNNKGLKIISKLYNLENLNLHLCKIGGRSLKHLAALKKLRKLNLCHTKVKDADLAFLPELKNLESVSLEMCSVTDACIPHLEALPSLEQLNISTTDITPEGILRLAELQNIRKLEIDGYGNKNFLLFRAGVAEKCFTLHDVDLTFEKLADDDLKYLEKYNQIRNLDLRCNKIEGAGLSYLTGFKHLMSLRLSLNPVTDENLVHLRELPRLRVLELENTEVTEAGIAMLRERFPKMLIRYVQK